MTGNTRMMRAAQDFDRSMRAFSDAMTRTGEAMRRLLSRVEATDRMHPVAVKPAFRGRRHGWRS